MIMAEDKRKKIKKEKRGTEVGGQTEYAKSKGRERAHGFIVRGGGGSNHEVCYI